MKHAKRMLSGVLVMCMLIGILSTGVFAAYSDTSNHWGETAIDRWSEYGILSGYQNGAFLPDGQITRGEMAKVIASLIQYQEQESNSYSDLSNADWHAQYILKLTAAGVIEGTGNGSISPDRQITRQETAVMLARAFGISAVNGSTGFTDDAQIASWAKGYVKAMSEMGAISGRGDGSFAPEANLTRAEAVTMIDNSVAAYITEPGVYTGAYDGIIIVAANDVVFEDAAIEGNIIYAGIIDPDTIELKNTTVSGEVIDNTVPESSEDKPAPTGEQQTTGGSNGVLGSGSGSGSGSTSSEYKVTFAVEGNANMVTVAVGDKTVTAGESVTVAKNAELTFEVVIGDDAAPGHYYSLKSVKVGEDEVTADEYGLYKFTVTAATTVTIALDDAADAVDAFIGALDSFLHDIFADDDGDGAYAFEIHAANKGDGTHYIALSIDLDEFFADAEGRGAVSDADWNLLRTALRAISGGENVSLRVGENSQYEIYDGENWKASALKLVLFDLAQDAFARINALEENEDIYRATQITFESGGKEYTFKLDILIVTEEDDREIYDIVVALSAKLDRYVALKALGSIEDHTNYDEYAGLAGENNVFLISAELPAKLMAAVHTVLENQGYDAAVALLEGKNYTTEQINAMTVRDLFGALTVGECFYLLSEFKLADILSSEEDQQNVNAALGELLKRAESLEALFALVTVNDEQLITGFNSNAEGDDNWQKLIKGIEIGSAVAATTVSEYWNTTTGTYLVPVTIDLSDAISAVGPETIILELDIAISDENLNIFFNGNPYEDEIADVFSELNGILGSLVQAGGSNMLSLEQDGNALTLTLDVSGISGAAVGSLDDMDELKDALEALADAADGKEIAVAIDGAELFTYDGSDVTMDNTQVKLVLFRFFEDAFEKLAKLGTADGVYQNLEITVSVGGVGYTYDLTAVVTGSSIDKISALADKLDQYIDLKVIGAGSENYAAYKAVTGESDIFLISAELPPTLMNKVHDVLGEQDYATAKRLLTDAGWPEEDIADATIRDLFGVLTVKDCFTLLGEFTLADILSSTQDQENVDKALGVLVDNAPSLVSLFDLITVKNQGQLLTGFNDVTGADNWQRLINGIEIGDEVAASTVGEYLNDTTGTYLIPITIDLRSLIPSIGKETILVELKIAISDELLTDFFQVTVEPALAEIASVQIAQPAEPTEVIITNFDELEDNDSQSAEDDENAQDEDEDETQDEDIVLAQPQPFQFEEGFILPW